MNIHSNQIDSQTKIVTYNGVGYVYMKALNEYNLKNQLDFIYSSINGKSEGKFTLRLLEIIPGDRKKYLCLSFPEPNSEKMKEQACKSYSNMVFDLIQKNYIPDPWKIAETDQEKIPSIILESLKILGFKATKQTKKNNLFFGSGYLSLIAINTGNDDSKQDVNLFPILVNCSSLNVTLKFISTKDTKWFIVEERFKQRVEAFLNEVSPSLHPSEKIILDSNSNGVCLSTEINFFGSLINELKFQKEFFSRFFYSLCTFTLISQYLYAMLTGVPVDINLVKKTLESSKRGKNFNLNNPKLDEPRIIYPEVYEKVTFNNNFEFFYEEATIIEKLKHFSNHFYWIQINHKKKSIKYPKFDGFSITQLNLRNSELMKSVFDFFIQISKAGFYLENFFENLMMYTENQSLVFYLKHNNFRSLFKPGNLISEFRKIFQRFIENSSEKLFEVKNKLNEISLSDFDSFDEVSMTGKLLNEDVKLMNIEKFSALGLNFSKDVETFGYIKVGLHRLVVIRMPVVFN